MTNGLRLFIFAALAIATVFGVIAYFVPTGQINMVIWVASALVVATILAHIAAEFASLHSKRWSAFWRWVDYLWVLAAFGALLIATAKYDLERAKQEAIQSDIILAQTAARLDQRCYETIAIIATTSKAGSIAHATLRDCIALKTPTLGQNAYEKSALDGALAQLENEATRSESATRIRALLTIPILMLPTESETIATKETVCSSIMRREELPDVLIVSGLNEGLANMVVNDFLHRLYPELKDGKPYWRPTPEVLAKERAFRNDQLVFCSGIKITQNSSRTLESKQKLWGMLKYLVDHHQAWYLAFAVFAGLRLGRSAFDSRPRP